MAVARMLAAMGVVALMSTPAVAQKAEPVETSAFGGIDFEINGNRVTGTYPKYQGRIAGTLVEAGVVVGIWTQPRSQRPCATQRNGTNAWGRFVITRFNQPRMSGSWGYCDD